MKPVEIEEFDIHSATFSVGENTKYRVLDLIEIAKTIEPFDLPLQGIDLAARPWGDNMNINSFIYHAKRMQKADLKYPIILDNTGYICDGWHRVTKAILEGRESIKAIRLNIMPDCIEQN